MKRIDIVKLFLLATVLISTGCKKGFLDKTPLASISVDSYYKTEDDAIKAVTAVYSILQTDMAFDGQFVNLLEVTTDDATGGGVGGEGNGTGSYLFQSTDNPFAASWGALYAGISRANLVTDKVPLIQMNVAKRDRLVGEAKFLRALYYFHLVNLYGEVPLFTNELAVKEANFPKSPVADVYAQIVKDLTEASAVLPLKSEYSSADAGRATKGAAGALLAKAYLFQQKWAEASAAALVVINSGEYTLRTNYRENFSNRFNNNSESIFEIQNSDIVQTGWNDEAVASIVPLWARPGNVTNSAGEGRGGWGGLTPSTDLENEFEATDLRKKETITQVANQVVEDGWVIGDKGSGYKLWATEGGWTEATEKDPYHQRLYRYSDLLLVCAEALAEQGNIANAAGGAAFYLNQVRSRAGLPNTTAATQAAMIAAVRHERRVELANEYHRLYDLRRWGIVGAKLIAAGKPFEPGKHELFPIPQTQIDLSKGILKQNLNY